MHHDFYTVKQPRGAHFTKAFALLAGLLVSNLVFAQTMNFIAKEVGGEILRQEGHPLKRHSPCSTFKIAIALMGYDAGVLIDEHRPEWPYKEQYQAQLDMWKKPHNPTAWIKNSCVWYSQAITKQLGMAKFKDYVNRFGYGNQDLSGDKGKDDGLTNAWLMSSLQISPKEQMLFIERLIRSELSVSKKAYEHTRKLLYIEDLPKGWKLFGKTGTGSDKFSGFQGGWFVGWIQKGEKYLTFAYYVEGKKEETIATGARAKNDAKIKMVELIQELDA